MIKNFSDFFDRDNKKMVYALFLLPYIFLFAYNFFWDISFIFLNILLLPVFFYTLKNINNFNIKIFNDKWLLFAVRVYLFLGFISFYYLWFSGTFYDKLTITTFLYFISSAVYLDRIYLIYYYIYRKILYKLVKKLISFFNFIYVKILTALLPVLLFLFSVYLFDNKNYFLIENNHLFNIINILEDKFFSNFHHIFFNKLLYLSVILVIFLFLIRYINKILSFFNKLIFNLSTFLIFIFWWIFLTIIYKYWWIVSNNNLSFIVYITLFSTAFVYLFLIALKQFFWMNWEWKNSIYKKLYNKIYWKNLRIGFFSTINKISDDKYIDNLFKDLDIFLGKYISYKSRSRDYLVLNNDIPITLWDKDLFWVWRFTESIFQIIEWYSFDNNNKESFSIGLVGEWWGWKSSVINLLREEFLDGYPWYKVYEFNPWNYEKKDLIEKFFNDLWLIIWNKKVSKLFKNYLYSLWELHKWFKFVEKLFFDTSLNNVKSDLNIELNKINDSKIIIIIDDLDRCEPDEILVMLNIIKNLWSLSNIIYLVSYDKDNIIKILNDKWFSSSYLDKIINFERYLPLNNEKALNDYFFEWLSDILSDIFEKKDKSKKLSEPLLKSMEYIHKIMKPVQESMESINKMMKPVQESIAKLSKYLESINGFWKLLSNVDKQNKKKVHKEEKNEKINKYEEINKEELLFHLQWELSYLFQNSNLRLLKKLLNHLKIVFITNIYTIWELHKIFKFTKDDYLNIIIINYLKLTDYKWFLEVVDFYNTKLWGIDWDEAEWKYSIDELPIIFKEQYYSVRNVLKFKILLELFSISEYWKNETRVISINKRDINKNMKIILEKFN